MNPVRGEVWMVDLGLAAKVRPCLVINIPFKDDERAIFCSRAAHDEPLAYAL